MPAVDALDVSVAGVFRLIAAIPLAVTRSISESREGHFLGWSPTPTVGRASLGDER